jgi:transcriptional regulator with XRE-family HTH domain
MSEVHLRLKELAQVRGLNLSQVQRQSGLTMGMVRRYWHNQTGQVTLEALGVLADLLEVKPGELLSNGNDETGKA